MKTRAEMYLIQSHTGHNFSNGFPVLSNKTTPKFVKGELIWSSEEPYQVLVR
jgi:hypothetical protein